MSEGRFSVLKKPSKKTDRAALINDVDGGDVENPAPSILVSSNHHYGSVDNNVNNVEGRTSTASSPKKKGTLILSTNTKNID